MCVFPVAVSGCSKVRLVLVRKGEVKRYNFILFIYIKKGRPAYVFIFKINIMPTFTAYLGVLC